MYVSVVGNVVIGRREKGGEKGQVGSADGREGGGGGDEVSLGSFGEGGKDEVRRRDGEGLDLLGGGEGDEGGEDDLLLGDDVKADDPGRGSSLSGR